MIRALFALATALTLATPLRAEVAIQEITTPGGINAWLVEEHSIPFTALEIRFQGGGSLDLPGKRGATNLMVGLLEEGAGDLDARAFTKAKESLAADLSYAITDDTVAVSARFLTENRAEVIALLRQSLIAPRFDTEAIERVRAQVLTGLRQDEKDPRALAARAFDAMAFAGHAYASSQEGTIESVSALTREDLLTAHQGALARDRLYVGAVGDITPADLSALLDELFADLPATGAALPEPITPAFPGGIHLTEFDTPQSVILFGQPGIDRDDPDFFAAFVIDHILGGGGLGSRLMQEVREQRGLTYGVYSYLADRDQAYWWGGSLNSQNERAAEAIEVIRTEWQKMRDEGVTEAELNDAKTYLTGAYPLRFDGNGPIASILVGMQMQGLPTSYITERNSMVNAVTLGDVKRVAERLMSPENLTFIVVGKPAGLPAN